MSNEISPDVDNRTQPILDIYYQKISSMSLEEKLEKCIQLSNSVRQLVLTGIMHRHPNSREEELRKKFAANILGEEIATKYYGWKSTDGL